MTYLKNKYARWYEELICQARKRHVDGYVEKHHVVPKSLGGSNDKANIVRLTAREHFIAHALLSRITAGQDRQKMLWALASMINDPRRHERYLPSGRSIAAAREASAKATSQRLTGRQLTAETKAKMSAAKVGKFPSLETRLKMSTAKLGTTVSSNVNAKKSVSMKQHYDSLSEEQRQENSKRISAAKIGRSNGHKGKTRSVETKQRMSDARKAYWAAKRAEKAQGPTVVELGPLSVTPVLEAISAGDSGCAYIPDETPAPLTAAESALGNAK